MQKVKLDEVDHQILDILIDNTRVPFTDISKRLLISPRTVHVCIKKWKMLESLKVLLKLRLRQIGVPFIAYVGIYIEKQVEPQKYSGI